MSYAKARVSSEGATGRRESDSMWLLSSLCPMIDPAHSAFMAWQLTSSTVSDERQRERDSEESHSPLSPNLGRGSLSLLLFYFFIYNLLKLINNFIYLFIYSWLRWVFVAAWAFL